MSQGLEILVHPLAMPIVVALVAGAIAYALSRWSPLACKLLAPTAAAAVLAGGIAILSLGGLQTPGLQWTWVQLTPGVALSLELAVSPVGMVVVIGAACFAGLIWLYSLRAMAGSYWEGKFHAYLIWALAGACAVGLADNLLVLLVGWELATLMLFLMINQGRAKAPAGAAKTYGVLGFADACLLLAVALLVAMDGGSANLSLSAGRMSLASAGPAGYVVYVLILIAALAKAGAIPLHSWIPAIAADAPTPVMAYLPAAVDKLLGIYLLSVLTLRMFQPDGAMQAVMMSVGALTVLAAVMMAMVQHNLKRLLAFHAVSQVGYMVLGIGTGTVIGVVGGLFHMLNHAIYKSTLFLMSGTVARAAGSDEIDEMGGLARALPATFGASLVAAAAISGIPPFNGFVSKWLVYQGTLQVANHGLAVTLLVVVVFGSALTLASFVKVIHSAFLSPAPRRGGPARQVRESFFLAAPMVLLAGACVLLGLWPQLALDYIFAPAVPGAEAAISAGAQGVRTGPIGIWIPTQATALILVGILLGLLFVWLWTRGKRVRIVRPFLAGEVPADNDDRFRVPGTHFYETISRLPLIGPLLGQAEGGAMDLYYWCSRHGQTLVDLLRRQHTGLLGLYVAWAVLGLAVTLIYLLVTMGT